MHYTSISEAELARYLSALPNGKIPEGILALFRPSALHDETVLLRERRQEVYAAAPVRTRPEVASEKVPKRCRIVGKQSVPSRPVSEKSVRSHPCVSNTNAVILGAAAMAVTAAGLSSAVSSRNSSMSDSRANGNVAQRADKAAAAAEARAAEVRLSGGSKAPLLTGAIAEESMAKRFRRGAIDATVSEDVIIDSMPVSKPARLANNVGTSVERIRASESSKDAPVENESSVGALMCSACGDVGHSDCTDQRCPKKPCLHCLCFGVATPRASEVCQLMQRHLGCHFCGHHACPFSQVEQDEPSCICSACAKPCHKDCSSDRCVMQPCPYCYVFSVSTPNGSALCLEMQRTMGCHRCGSTECVDNVCFWRKDMSFAPYQNMGTSCYINATLHALFASPTVVQFLKGYCIQNAAWFLRMIQDKQRAMTELVSSSNMAADARLAMTFAECYFLADAGVSIFPQRYLESPFYMSGQQQDCVEFFKTILSGGSTEVVDVEHVFQGSEVFYLKCPSCFHCESLSDGKAFPFTCLDLSITSQYGVCTNVQEALDYRFACTPVDSTFAWKGCPACGTTTGRPFHQQRLRDAPQTLVVQLKRFVHTGQFISKLSHNVQATTIISIEGHTYKLCSAVVHRGDAYSGHYWAMTLEQSQGTPRWYTVNDSQKLPTTLSEWAQPYDWLGFGQFYMLVYTKQ